MDCLGLAQALAQAYGHREALARGLDFLRREGYIRCGEAYWVGRGLRLVQLEACREACPLAHALLPLAQKALETRGPIEAEGALALPIQAQGRVLAVLVLHALRPLPTCLEPLLLLALRRPEADLAARLLFAQEEERRRVGRELHDQVGSLLTAALLSLRMAEKNPLRIQDAREAVQEALETVRRLSKELRIPFLEDLGLQAALERYAEELRGRGLEVELDLDLPPLSPEASTALFRVVQEALTNVARHARAQRAWVRIRTQGDRVHGEVGDDGQGFDPRATPASVGILGMQERVRALGGSLLIESQPGQGTRVRFAFPL